MRETEREQERKKREKKKEEEKDNRKRCVPVSQSRQTRSSSMNLSRNFPRCTSCSNHTFSPLRMFFPFSLSHLSFPHSSSPPPPPPPLPHTHTHSLSLSLSFSPSLFSSPLFDFLFYLIRIPNHITGSLISFRPNNSLRISAKNMTILKTT